MTNTGGLTLPNAANSPPPVASNGTTKNRRKRSTSSALKPEGNKIITRNSDDRKNVRCDGKVALEFENKELILEQNSSSDMINMPSSLNLDTQSSLLSEEIKTLDVLSPNGFTNKKSQISRDQIEEYIRNTTDEERKVFERILIEISIVKLLDSQEGKKPEEFFGSIKGKDLTSYCVRKIWATIDKKYKDSDVRKKILQDRDFAIHKYNKNKTEPKYPTKQVYVSSLEKLKIPLPLDFLVYLNNGEIKI